MTTLAAETVPPPRPAAARRIFGLRASALAELAVFFAVALAIDWLFFAGARFAGVTPHPFWAIVVLVSVQYGVTEGLVAAACASAALLLFSVPSAALGEDLHLWLMRVLREPVLWFAASLVIGELQQRQRRERGSLRLQLRESEERERTVADAYRRLERLKETLEARVAGQLRTVFSTYAAARAIEKLGTSEVLIGIGELVRSILNPTKFSVFLLKGERLEMSSSEGWVGEDRFDIDFDAASPLFQAVVSRRQSLAAVRPADAHILGDQGVLAGPLASVDTGEIVGMLKIEQLGFLDFGPLGIQNFRILCEWIGTALANARRFEESKHATYFDPLRNLLSANFFEQQREIIAKLAARVNFNVTVIYLRVGGTEEIDPDQRIAYARMVASASNLVLRTTDLRFDYRQSGWDFAVVLPGTDLKGATLALGKLVAAVKQQLDAANLDVPVTHLVESIHQCR
jgi:GGDEF domain-containing protein